MIACYVPAVRDRREPASLAAGTDRIGRRHSTILEGLDTILNVALDLLALLGRQHLAHGLELLAAEVPPCGPLGLVLLGEGGMDLADLAALLLGQAEPIGDASQPLG